MKTLVKLLSAASMGVALVLFTGCASIISGRHQAVTFTSSPDNAVVTVDGKQIGKTPITAQLDRKGGAQIVTLEKPGYKIVTFQLKATVNGWFFGNLIFGGLFGSSTDSSTGAINAYSQDMFNFALTPLDASTPPPSTEVKTFVITNYKSITEELNTKPDQYLKALFTLLKVKPEQEADFTQKIKTLADENKDIVGFADKVAALMPQ
jgi:hypothetical protein